MLRATISILFLSYSGMWSFITPYLSWISVFIATLLNTSSLTLLSYPIIRLDVISLSLILLTRWILKISFTRRWTVKKLNSIPNKFSPTIITLISLLLLRFTASNILLFYILFEASLIPIIIMIITWGYQPERIKARIYIIIYTIAASLPLLISLAFILKSSPVFWTVQHYNYISSIITLSLIIGFLVKLPVYGLHLWLPKAHTEAPVAGSIILASIILKLGRYGLIRILTILPSLINNIRHLSIPFFMWGAIITAILCLRQHDLKEAVAYASVRHISLIAAALITKSHWATTAIILMNLGHGVTRSILFSIVNTLYESSTSRTIALNKGIISLTPPVRALILIALLRNGGAPPFVNLISEIFIFIPIITTHPSIIIPLAFISFISIVYSIFIFITVSHGSNLNTAKTNNHNPVLSAAAIFHILLLAPSLLIAQYVII